MPVSFVLPPYGVKTSAVCGGDENPQKRLMPCGRAFLRASASGGGTWLRRRRPPWASPFPAARRSPPPRPPKVACGRFLPPLPVCTGRAAKTGSGDCPPPAFRSGFLWSPSLFSGSGFPPLAAFGSPVAAPAAANTPALRRSFCGMAGLRGGLRRPSGTRSSPVGAAGRRQAAALFAATPPPRSRRRGTGDGGRRTIPCRQKACKE